MELFSTKITEDGTKTYYSEEFCETFHSKYGAKKEAEITYIKGCLIPEKANNKNTIKIIDICFGLGYNTASAIDYFLGLEKKINVEIYGLELDEKVPNQALNDNLFDYWQPKTKECLKNLIINKKVNNYGFNLTLLLGDARQTIKVLVKNNFKADAIFLDPFSPPKCPQLWTVEFLSLVGKCLNNDGIIATYSCSAAVRQALILNNLYLGANFCVGRRSPGTLASYSKDKLPPLSVMEWEHLQTKASIPFRDPSLTDSAEKIKERRQQEQLLSTLESSSQWKKRWFPR